MRSRRLGILSSRVGRRTLGIFLGSVVLPVVALAAFAYWEIRNALIERTQLRVEAAAKEQAVAVVERAIAARDEFVLLARHDTSPAAFARGRILRIDEERAERITLDHASSGRVHAGETVLLTDTGATPRLRLVRRPGSSGAAASLVTGEVALSGLVGFKASDDLDPALCVLERRTRGVLGCSAGVTASERDAVQSGQVNDADGPLLAASRSVFLKHELGAGDWEVVAFRRRTEALLPMQRIGRTFVLVAMLSMLVVFFASHVQLRRVTTPLAVLTSATHAVRDGDFRTRIALSTDDEFGELATSFNAMSTQLGRTFDSLAAVDAVDRVALSSRDVGAIIDIAQRHVLAACNAARVVVMTPSADTFGDTWLYHDLEAGERLAAPQREGAPPPDDIREGAECDPAPLQAFRLAEAGVPAADTLRWTRYPLRQGALEGVMAVGMPQAFDPGSEAGIEARRLAQRLAAALENVRLVRQLEAMGLGTLTAFARAVDANSPWTAGHSERVTMLALDLGARLGLASGELDTLRRGGLLHDIGKIGVPVTVLDKAGPLSDEEFSLMRSHPVLGHRILSPIGALRDALPIVRSHHERVDGFGYPDGLRGDEIPWLARVLAVADVFDALVSDRPYRKGMPHARAVAIVREGSGSHFDPEVVRAFEAHLHAGAQLHARRRDPHPSCATALRLEESFS